MLSNAAAPIHQAIDLLKLEANAIHQAAERLDVVQVEKSTEQQIQPQNSC